MKVAIIYSSRTGNTEKLAKAMFSKSSEETEIYDINNIPPLESFDIVFLGFWVYKGSVDPKMSKVIQNIENKNVAFFGTLGAYPDSEHAQKVINNVNEILEKNNVLGSFLCQGRVDSAIQKKHGTKSYSSSKHPMTPERMKRLKEAELHPDERDINNIIQFMNQIVQVAPIK